MVIKCCNIELLTITFICIEFQIIRLSKTKISNVNIRSTYLKVKQNSSVIRFIRNVDYLAYYLLIFYATQRKIFGGKLIGPKTKLHVSIIIVSHLRFLNVWSIVDK